MKAVTIRSKTDAIQALEKATRLKEEAEALMEKHGITTMLEEAEELKKKATKYADSKNIKRLPLSDGRYGTLITSVHERVWVGTKSDIPADAPEGIEPLKSLVSKEAWMQITKRVPDPELIEQAVGEGLITQDEISPAYFERMRAAYFRVFGNANGK